MARLSILLAEDNQLLRWWITSSLHSEGLTVAAPTSVDETISLAASTSFDVLITDWRLAHDHNGLEVLARAREKSPGILAILISAEADAAVYDRARASGFDYVIEKPFPVAEIVGAVQRLTGNPRREATH